MHAKTHPACGFGFSCFVLKQIAGIKVGEIPKEKARAEFGSIYRGLKALVGFTGPNQPQPGPLPVGPSSARGLQSLLKLCHWHARPQPCPLGRSTSQPCFKSCLWILSLLTRPPARTRFLAHQVRDSWRSLLPAPSSGAQTLQAVPRSASLCQGHSQLLPWPPLVQQSCSCCSLTPIIKVQLTQTQRKTRFSAQ